MVSHLGKGGDDRATHSVSVVFVAAETNSRKLFSAAVWPPRNYQWLGSLASLTNAIGTV
jgi:hypothetical protein